MEPLDQDQVIHGENKIKSFFKKAWSFVIYVFVFSIFIAVVLVGLALTMDESQEKAKQEEKNKIDLQKRFVTFKEGKDGKKSIILDVENHCLYIGESGAIQSPLVKDKQFDCNVKYTEEYKNKNKKGDNKK